MGPYFVPDEFLHPPPPGHLERVLYLKHIDIRGRRVQPPIRYDRVEGGCLFLEYLISTDGPQVRKLCTSCAMEQQFRHTGCPNCDI